MLQAAIDESFESDGVFVLAGYVATAEAWEKFSVTWQKMLRHFGTPRGDGRYHFKMSEMAARPDGIAKCEPFFRVIEEHALGWVSAKIDQSELRRAIARISIPGAAIEDWGDFANPWYITFRTLIDMFHIERRNMRAAFRQEKINFFFDDRSDKKAVLDVWENYIKHRPAKIRKYYGAIPQFKDDTDFLPLQAADFWAWWVRKWYVEGDAPDKVLRPDFGVFRLRGTKHFMRVEITFNEDQLTKNLIQAVRQQINPKREIVDLKTKEVF